MPVRLYAAIEDRTVHFRELHAKDGAPIEHRRVSAKTGREVPPDRIVKGYETSRGRWVLLTDAEIKAIEAPARKAIEIEDFVPAEQVDPAFYGRPYHLGVGDDGREPYAVLHAALTKGLRRRFEPEQYSDEYRARVLDHLARKARGEDVELPAEQAPEATGDDLAAALEASVKAVRG